MSPEILEQLKADMKYICEPVSGVQLRLREPMLDYRKKLFFKTIDNHVLTIDDTFDVLLNLEIVALGVPPLNDFQMEVLKYITYTVIDRIKEKTKITGGIFPILE